MSVYTFDPRRDPRWNELVNHHPAGSVFHTSGWVDALHRTYGYEPVVYTTSPPAAPLSNGVLLCRVSSWLTGRRLVSVPFADHCEPLVALPEERRAILDALASAARTWNFVELRPVSGPWTGAEAHAVPSSTYSFHVLDLGPTLDDLFRNTHQSTIQRNIRKAEREGLTYEEGQSDAFLMKFYALLLLTRRRHGLPPQPIEWFRHLMSCLGERLMIRVVSKDGRLAGSMLTLQHGRTLVYKYGCSDAGLHKLGTMPFLFWRTIQAAKAAGLDSFDLGRSDLSNAGLIAFKTRLGATASSLTYLRMPEGAHRAGNLRSRVPRRLLARLPDSLFVTAGRLLYPHMG